MCDDGDDRHELVSDGFEIDISVYSFLMTVAVTYLMVIV